MFRLLLIGLLVIALTVIACIAFVIPFATVAILPIIWTAIGFLLFSEVLFVGLLIFCWNKRGSADNALALSALFIPGIYLVLSAVILPLSFLLPTVTAVVVIHCALIIGVVAFLMLASGVILRNREETESRQQGRSAIQRIIHRLEDKIHILKSLQDREFAEEIKCLEQLIESVRYGGESTRHSEEIDRELDVLLDKLDMDVDSIKNGKQADTQDMLMLLEDLKYNLKKRERILIEKR